MRKMLLAAFLGVGCWTVSSIPDPEAPGGGDTASGDAASETANRFRDDGFYSRVGPFRIAYLGGARPQALGPDWLLDNYLFWRDGEPRVETLLGGYTLRLRVDPVGDGRYSFETEIPTFDLHWTQRNDAAIVWIRSIPLSRRLSERDLSVIAHDFVESLSGTEAYAVCFDWCVHAEAKTYATTIVAERELFLSGVPAYDLTFEIANVDQLQLNPDARAARARLVLARPGYWMDLRSGDRSYEAATLVAIGYAQTPDRFDEHLAEFEDLLQRIDFWPGGVPVDAGTSR
jgi:hypothetical protein